MRLRRRSSTPPPRCWIQSVSIAVLVSLLLIFTFNVGLFCADTAVGQDRHSLDQAATVTQIRRRHDQGDAVDLYRNDLNVVHIIQTRLMQFQPNLLALGAARLKIFEAFTVSSLKHQTTHAFLWIIRTDPDLEAVLKDKLRLAVAGMENVVVIASNFNPEGFRDAGSIANITRQDVWVGSWDMLQAHHRAAQDRILIESRLDADDALNVEFCRSVQEHAVQQLRGNNTAWSVGCAEYHVEWQQHSPWNETDPDKGALLGLSTQLCITPGLTFSYGSAAARSDLPAGISHHKLHSLLKACSDDNTVNCLYRLPVPDNFPLAVRARTICSAGMANLILQDGQVPTPALRQLEHSRWRGLQDNIWGSLVYMFGLEPEDIWRVRAYLEEHQFEVATDALKGQCTKGHSCKDDSRAALKTLLKTHT